MVDESIVADEEITDEEVTSGATNEDDSLEALLSELDSDEESDEVEEVDDKQKQINDLKAQLGRINKANKAAKEPEVKVEETKEVEEKEEVKFDVNSAMAEDLLIANNPEVKNILPTLKAHADKLGTTVYELYKTDATYKTMAQSFKTEQNETEQNFNKINKPSEAAFSGKSVENVSDEDLEQMTGAQRLKVLQELQKREGLN